MSRRLVDKTSSSIKNIIHGFFLSIATTIAEPATILPLIVSHFSSSSLLVGIFASLLKGGAIFVQMFAAFYAQTYRRAMPYLRVVFVVRFLSWFGIGVVLLIWGESSPVVALFGIGIGLFIFSFSAGFGAIYFNEIQAKVFTHKYRGKSMAYRQFFAGFGAIISGATAGLILNSYEAPKSFAYLFLVSTLLMGVGLFAYATILEPSKKSKLQKERNFRDFLRKALSYLKEDKNLLIQVFSYLLFYGYLLSLPFIVLDAKEKIELSGTLIGVLISVQMSGAMLSNISWGRLSGKGRNTLIIKSSFILMILSVAVALFASLPWHYATLFFLVGAATDGARLAYSNLILIRAPEDRRPIYVALQANISSFGLFFAIPGGIVLQEFGYTALYVATLSILVGGLLLVYKLPRQ